MIDTTCSIDSSNSFIKYFSKLSDPRTTYRGNLKHPLIDIVFLVIAAVVSGADGWKSIELFGKSQILWLRKYVPLSSGIPSHDTLGRFFGSLDHQAFSSCFMSWIQEISELNKGEVIAIDGKRLRGSYDTSSNKSAIHMVSAFAVDNGLCLGQSLCSEKSNEITAIPKLLELLVIKGCTITIDAMGCQTEIAQQIIAKEADYILAVKDNQKELHTQIQKMFTIKKPSVICIDEDLGHGRVEKRKCSIIDDLTFFDSDKEWKCLRTLIKIDSERFTKVNGKYQKETRYYISSLKPEISINKKIRDHWAVENNLHWMLDVNFNEDASRKRIGDSAANYNIIAKTALTLISKANAPKGTSKKNKRYLAALSPEFRENVIQV